MASIRGRIFYELMFEVWRSEKIEDSVYFVCF